MFSFLQKNNNYNFITDNWKLLLFTNLFCLLLSSILPISKDRDQGVLGIGVFFFFLVVYLAKNNDRGYPTKRIYTIVRYVIAMMLLIVLVGDFFYMFTLSQAEYMSVYTLVVYGALIAYLLSFKPSNTTVSKKILKVIGYTLVLVAINALQQVSMKTISYYSSLSQEKTNWGMLVILGVIMFIGVICGIIANKTTERHTT